MMKQKKLFLLAFCVTTLVGLSACTEARYAAHVVKQIPMPGERSKSVGHFKVGAPYTIKGRRYTPVESYEFVQTGIASWYGPNFHGKLTANGEIFNKHELTAAHKTLQLPSIIRVTNLENGRNIILRVNDRGPFAHDRILDVSERAATVLGFKNKGIAKIRMEVLADASHDVATRAKAGENTSGYEVALNQRGGQIKSQARNIRPASVRPMPKPEPVTQVALSSSAGTPIPRPDPRFTNTNTRPPLAQGAPLRKPLPVQAEALPASNGATPISRYTSTNIANANVGNIYVQAGSFSQEQNALSLSNRLSTYGPSRVYMTRVNDTPYFRVRLGPYDNKESASQILTALTNGGNNNAVIVVD